ncbi:MAG: phosphate signaling complex protein PhoU [Ardenticatenaceae bacterium]|nr:phosphate signaling complex protein PhoU [Ardenticatenaceae bacterium]HBY98864.1 phosphate transport system regulatory protein PhoU [Chloroflexota bacterium]
METRGTFHHRLDELGQDIVRLGSMVDEAIHKSVEALRTRDVELAQEVIAADETINELRFSIEERSFALIATQQPMASDLRSIIAAMNIAVEVERMGDHAAGIARLVGRMADEPLLKPLIDIPRMAITVRQMLRRSLDAYLKQDIEVAQQVSAQDDEVDEFYNQIFRELVSFMIEDPSTVTRATYLLWVTHNLERIGDRVTNICERVIYMVTGQLMEFSSDRQFEDLAR